MAAGSSYGSHDTNERNRNLMCETIELTKRLENVIVEENDVAVFECQVYSGPQTTCSWYRNGEIILPSEKMHISRCKRKHCLEINNTTAADNGVYELVCKNSFTQFSCSACLFVADRSLSDVVCYPQNMNTKDNRIAFTAQTFKVNVGEDLVIVANFEQEVLINTVSWYKNNKVILENTRVEILTTQFFTSLDINNAELTDSGVYFAVARTEEGIISNFSSVLVTAAVTHSNKSVIEDILPDELEVYDNEDVRLSFKATIEANTAVEWCHGNTKVSCDHIQRNYGARYIELKLVKPSRQHGGVYTVIIRNKKTGRELYSSCALTINQLPTNILPEVEIKRPILSVAACIGSKVTFDCSFAIQDPTYFFVVWHVGRYRVERSDSRFRLMCKGGEFILYIKKVEPGMIGEVVCDLRKAIINEKSVLAASSTAKLVIVPREIIKEEEMNNSLSTMGKLHIDTCPYDKEVMSRSDTGNLGNIDTMALNNNWNIDQNVTGAILEIIYCKLNNDGLFFLHASKNPNEVGTSHLVVCEKTPTTSGIILIQWEDITSPKSYWYGIDLRQNDGTYVQAGVSSLPSIEIKHPQIEGIVSCRVRTVPASEASDSTVCIEPYRDTAVKAPNNLELQSMEDFDLKYTMTNDVIGKGAFGSVLLVRDDSGGQYAAKCLSTIVKKKHDAAKREFEIMQKLHHPRLIELMGAFEAPGTFILVMDYLWGGELFDRVAEEDHIDETGVVPYVRQICEGLQYLQSHRIIHLDLKPENIVCLTPNSAQVKIIDFGLARILEPGRTLRIIDGTKYYIAPEVVNYEPLTLSCDMWSLGVITYMLLSGLMPFYGDTWVECTTRITSGNYNYEDNAFWKISDVAKDFVNQLLVLKPSKRMSATAALNHKWIKEGPPEGAKPEHMKLTRQNLKKYLSQQKNKWMKANLIVRAAHRLRAHVSGPRPGTSAE